MVEIWEDSDIPMGGRLRGGGNDSAPVSQQWILKRGFRRQHNVRNRIGVRPPREALYLVAPFDLFKKVLYIINYIIWQKPETRSTAARTIFRFSVSFIR